MISATVAPARRWRMSITCLSRRERVAGDSSEFFGISVAAMGNRLGLRVLSLVYVEKSTVLNFQQQGPFVKAQFFGGSGRRGSCGSFGRVWSRARPPGAVFGARESALEIESR